jgi:hypothetical protein
LENLGGRTYVEDLAVDEIVMLEWMLGEIMVEMCGLDSSSSGYAPVAGSFECRNELRGSNKKRGIS